jgi:hypothetical protein
MVTVQQNARPIEAHHGRVEVGIAARDLVDVVTGQQRPARHTVEVVTVQVGENHRIEPRQLPERHGRLCQPPRAQSLAQVGALSAVHEVGVGEQRERAQPHDRGGRADERQRGQRGDSDEAGRQP